MKRFNATFIVLLMCTAIQAATITITKLEPVASDFGDLSGNSYDLTALGTADWVTWDGSSGLTPFDSMNGGSGIGTLTYDSAGSPVPGTGSAITGRDPSYSWTNGTNTPSRSGGFNVLTSNSDPAVGNGGTASVGQTFSLTIDADVNASSLYVLLAAQNSFFDIDASLPGASQTLNVGTGANSTDTGWYRIDFTADNVSDQLTIDFTKTAVTGGSTSNFGIQAAALTVIPEPSTIALVGIAFASLVVMRRKQR